MTITSRPDVLPFALPTRFGLPFHGAVKVGKLTTLNSSEMSYPQPETGSTWAVSNPTRRQAQEKSDDPILNHSWRNYALLSGTYRQLGGRNLGANAWLYSDSNGNVWKLTATLTVVSDTCTLTVRVTEQFGVFGRGIDAPTRTIGSASLTLPNSTVAAGCLTTGEFCLDQSEDGSDAVWNLYTSYNLTSLYEEAEVGLGSTCGIHRLAGYFVITVSGDGSVAPGDEGANLSALVVARDFDDYVLVDVAEGNSSTNTGSPNPCSWLGTGSVQQSNCSGLFIIDEQTIAKVAVFADGSDLRVSRGNDARIETTITWNGVVPSIWEPDAMAEGTYSYVAAQTAGVHAVVASQRIGCVWSSETNIYMESSQSWNAGYSETWVQDEFVQTIDSRDASTMGYSTFGTYADGSVCRLTNNVAMIYCRYPLNGSMYIRYKIVNAKTGTVEQTYEETKVGYDADWQVDYNGDKWSLEPRTAEMESDETSCCWV